NAIKKISVQRGYDVTEYTLCCFGGAAGQHACLVADALGMSRVLIHPLAGVLSAYGIGIADVIVMKQRAVETMLEARSLAALEAPLAELERQALEDLRVQGVEANRVRLARCAALKYEGTDSTLQIALTGAATAAELVRTFQDRYRTRFGLLMRGRAIVIESIAVEGVAASQVATLEACAQFEGEGGNPKPAATRTVHFAGARRDTPLFERERLRPGDLIDGPAILCESNTTTVVEPGWQAECSWRGDLVLHRVQPAVRAYAVGTQADPVVLEVFNNLFMSIAEQMGVALANTATSVNIKERLDFSCAVFDADGQLIANAPHMPVHLGSMGEAVQEIMRRRRREMRPGDMFALNAPYAGGTHLPDVTVVMPVFVDAKRGDEADRDQESGDAQGPPRAASDLQPTQYNRQPDFFVAARGHHADIGGITPGSMPASSTHIDEEGVLLDNVQLVSAGAFLEKELRELLGAGTHAARNVEQNLADLRAQVAACQKGACELQAAVDHFGLHVVRAYMQHVQDNAEEAVRRVIDKLHAGAFEYPMDNGAVVRVAIRTDQRTRCATIDFTGSSPQQPHNFNAPFPVTRAAVLYVFRTLIDDEIPLNAGCLKPLSIIAPEGSMLNPRYPAAVVAGNVETSQVITDCLYGALGALAASQGTMNNFTFGDGEHQYYETIAGGSGAGPDFDGADAVQTHMTNSRLTDPEVLEWRFPVRLESFRIRRESGGRGTHRGGDGVDRRVRFLKPMAAVLLANHRRIAPFGLAGGEPGLPGRNWIERADGRIEEFGATHEAQMQTGDLFVIQTPGGGGYGKSG
ncbi:MAG TPA: hydantoinase B/oxoprolinase family protein, partial [Steroidobacter sp.]|nr:hydantoinase B/oxoprolinase family protein [Steroidobacter sp.]